MSSSPNIKDSVVICPKCHGENIRFGCTHTVWVEGIQQQGQLTYFYDFLEGDLHEDHDVPISCVCEFCFNKWSLNIDDSIADYTN